MNPTYDAIIVGGGIMGCSAAFELAGRGMKVALIEKAALGSGSTGKSSAVIRQHYSNVTTAQMALHSLRVFQNFSEVIGGESGFTETGFLVLTPGKDHEGLLANIELQRSVGIRTELISAGDINRRWPYLATDDLVAAAYEPESGFADPNLTLNSYAAAARAIGAEIFQDTEVTGVRLRSGAVQGVDSSAGEFDSPIVINCTGPWAASTWSEIKVPIDSCRVQVALFRRPAEHSHDHPTVADFAHATYWRPETGGLTLVGLIDPSEQENVVDPDQYNESLDLSFQVDAGERLVRRYPGMERSDSASGYAALYAISPDWHPIMDELMDGSGYFMCAGFSGHGFKLGPAVGLMVADMVTGIETEGMDRRLFRLNRFEEGEPVSGRYEYSIAG